MLKYFSSENLKIKNTFLSKLTWIMPMLTILIAFFLTANYFQIDSYNWWYTMMLPGFVSLSCSLLSKVDGIMKNRAVLSLPVDMKKVWVAKVLVGIKNLAVACSIIFVCSQLEPILIGSQMLGKFSILTCIAATVLLIITFMWQVPLCMFLGNKIGIFPTTLINMLMNFIFAILSIKKYWWVIPYSYPARLMCPVLKVLPNGLLAQPGSQTFTPDVLSYTAIPIGVSVSVVLFLVLTYFTAKWYKTREAI